MARKCFFSFHYLPDNWRVGTIRGIGAIEGNQPALDNAWEKVTKGGDSEIQKWIDSQMKGRTCAIVLIGENTAKRKWIDYEIKKAWDDGMGVLGIHIHGIKDKNGFTSNKGHNPFLHLSLGKNSSSLGPQVYDPNGIDSKAKYNNIAENIDSWIEKAIEIRNKN